MFGLDGLAFQASDKPPATVAARKLVDIVFSPGAVGALKLVDVFSIFFRLDRLWPKRFL